MQKYIFHLVLIIQLNLGIILYLSGFFPMKHSTGKIASYEEIPDNISLTKMDKAFVYAPKIDKLIIMIIDALRYDMLENSASQMVFLKNILENKEHCLIKSKVEAPTVTMPRIKALTTGSVPAFIDAVLNLKQYQVSGDSIIHQAFRKGLKSVFYGDETWLKMFPHMFIRNESTHSFVVTDYTEVDSNVTRHVKKELKHSDWDIMILHYLGLDHIGHLSSPYSDLVGPKLKEMDSVINDIYQYILKREEQGEKVTLLIGSDHGMKDSGGHGGTSYGEVTVPYLFINFQCDKNIRNEEINQIDLTPMLSVLLGLPIPAESIGVLHEHLIHSMGTLPSLFAIHYNTLKIFEIYKNNNLNMKIHLNSSEHDISHIIEEAGILFEKAIVNNFSQFHQNQALNYYTVLQNHMSQSISRKGVGYDILSMTLAVVLFGQVLFHLFVESVPNISAHSLLLYTVAVLFSSSFLYQKIQLDTYCKVSSSIYSLLLMGNLFLLKPKKNFFIKDIKTLLANSDFCILMFVGVIHLLLYTSTSFLEEEHLVWYYVFQTLLLLDGFSSGIIKRLIQLAVFAVLRHLNSTGIQYSSSPDIADWLNDTSNQSYQFVLYMLGLALLVFWWIETNDKNLNEKPSWKINLFMYIILISLAFLVLLFKVSPASLLIPFISKRGTSTSVFSPETLWTFVIVIFVLYIIANHRIFIHTFQERKAHLFLTNSFSIFLFVISFMYAIVCQPQNILLAYYVLYNSSEINKYSQENALLSTGYYFVLGVVSFYLQGNSISLASVDVAAGYKTLKNPDILTAGLLVFINTYGLPIMSYLCLFKHLYSSHKYNSQDFKCFQMILIFSTFHIFHFSIIVFFQRYHLFIWSVFAPKLLHVSVFISLTTFLLAVPILFKLIIFCINPMGFQIPTSNYVL